MKLDGICGGVSRVSFRELSENDFPFLSFSFSLSLSLSLGDRRYVERDI